MFSGVVHLESISKVDDFDHRWPHVQYTCVDAGSIGPNGLSGNRQNGPDDELEFYDGRGRQHQSAVVGDRRGADPGLEGIRLHWGRLLAVALDRYTLE